MEPAGFNIGAVMQTEGSQLSKVLGYLFSSDVYVRTLQLSHMA